MSVVIRQAKPDDLKAVQDLNHQLFISDNRHFNDLNLQWPYEEEGEKFFRTRISGESGVCFVAELDGRVLGYLAGCIRSKSSVYKGVLAELDNMFVEEIHRSQGIGGSLIDTFVDWARQKGAQKMIVDAYSPNVGAIKLYTRKGFEPYSLNLRMDLKGK